MNTAVLNKAPLLSVENLRTVFVTDAGVVQAVDGVSIQIPRGKTVALVGESGCGKSVTALSIMRLIASPPGEITAGRVLFAEANGEDQTDLLTLGEDDLRRIRGRRIAMIFQDPAVALHPVYCVGEQIVEAIELHRPVGGRAARSAAVELLRRVGLPSPRSRFHDYPHELSGGMCQRVMIAMALAGKPALLIADEPTTALDVTVQAQILGLLSSLQSTSGLGILLITHDLGMVSHIADWVYVMYAGRIVEHAAAGELFDHPLHPYTQALMRCTPRLTARAGRLDVIPGDVPEPTQLPSGCRFHPRCRLAVERAQLTAGPTVRINSPPGDGKTVPRRCAESYAEEPSGLPELRELMPGHFVACWEASSALGNDSDRSGGATNGAAG